MLNITVLLHNVIFSVAAGLFVQLNAELLVQQTKVSELALEVVSVLRMPLGE